MPVIFRHQAKEYTMGTEIVILLIVLGVGGVAWRRRRYRQAYDLRVSSQNKPKENLAQKAFIHGNTCLMEGKFNDARDAFQQVLELEPKHPHVTDQLAEVERQKTAVSSAKIRAC